MLCLCIYIRAESGPADKPVMNGMLLCNPLGWWRFWRKTSRPSPRRCQVQTVGLSSIIDIIIIVFATPAGAVRQ